MVISGAGERGLCAGGDITVIHRDAAALAGSVDDVAAADSPSGALWRDEYNLNAVATDRTRLAMPEVGIGLVPDVGGTWLLSQLPDELGTYAALTTNSFGGADAVAVGLATHYVPAGALPEFLAALADQTPSDALAVHAVDAPASDLGAQRDWIRIGLPGDSVADIVARCAAGEEPARRAADKIAMMSPMSLAVTLHALHALRAAASDASPRDTLRANTVRRCGACNTPTSPREFTRSSLRRGGSRSGPPPVSMTSHRSGPRPSPHRCPTATNSPIA